MSNETLWFLYLFFDLSVTLIALRYFGKAGLYAVIIWSIILCNIQVLKLVPLFGTVVSFGNITYAGIFLATDLLGELYGKKEARTGVFLGFFALVFMTIALQISIALAPHPADIHHDAMLNLFQIAPRIAFASITAYLFSQLHDVWSFHWLKSFTKGRYLWLRNNCSTLTSQVIDTSIFMFIAFWGILDKPIFIEIFVTTLVFKWVVALFDTPFIYLGRYLQNFDRKQTLDSHLTVPQKL